MENKFKLKEKIIESLKICDKLNTSDKNLEDYIDSVNLISKKQSNSNQDFINLVMHGLLPDYEIHKQIGDGACMFRSFNQILGIDHKILRQKSVNYVCEQWNFYKGFCLKINGDKYESSDEYRNYMSKYNTWGTHIELNALCTIYNINVIILDINIVNKRINVTKIEQKSEQVIHLIYTHYNGEVGHYDIILP